MPESTTQVNTDTAVTDKEAANGGSVLTGEQTQNSTTQVDPAKAAADKAAADAKAKSDADVAKAREGMTDAQKAEADKKAADNKAKADAEKAKGVPEKYEFKAPDGVKLDEEGVAKLSTIAKELGLSNENAQKFADLAIEHTAKLQAAQNKAWADTRETWVNGLKSDEVIGKANWDKSMEAGNRAIAHVLPHAPELKDAMKLGLLDHPGIFKALSFFGKRMGEGKLIDGAPSTEAKTPDQILYPST